jgi:hypothetical protein
MTVSPSVTLTPPIWAGEFLSPQRLIPAGGKLNLSEFFPTDSVLVTVSGANAQGATTLNVTALPTPTGWSSGTIIPNGTTIHFGGDEYATVNDASVLPGDTAITVLALTQALEGGETGRYTGTGKITVPSGTVVGRTFAERDSNTRYGPATTGDEDVFIVAFDEPSIVENDGDVTLVKPGTVIKENFLPGWAGLSAAVKALVRDRYVTQLGVA